jgi:hypothetical protein
MRRDRESAPSVCTKRVSRRGATQHGDRRTSVAPWHTECSLGMNHNSQSSQSPAQKQQPGSSSAKQASATSRRDDAARDQGAVAEEARALGSQAKDLASDVAGQVAQSAERQFAGGKGRAAEAITQIAGALRHTGDELAQEMPVVHDYLGRVATQVEGMSSYLQTKQLGDVVGDLESFARREPVLFMGSAFVVGLLGGRFMKSSRPATVVPATEGRGSGR